MLKKSNPLLSVALVVALASISGCTAMPRELLGDTSKATLAPIDTPLNILGQSSEDIVEIASDNMFISIPAGHSDPMPDIQIRKVSFSGSNPADVIKTLVAGTDISVVVRNEAQSSLVMRHTVTATNISGKLEDVISRLSDSVGFFYQYKNGVLEITSDMLFIAELPPVNSVFESLPQMLKTLGASDVFLDKSSRTLTYRASKVVQEKVSRYLTYIRENKSLIVYDTYIWEVVLNDSKSMAINWNKLNYTPNNQFGMSVSGGGADIAGSLGVGVVYNTANFALDVLAKFLQTQGTLRTISQPKLTLISGGTATFRNGNSINYVSQVGTTTNGNATTTSVTTAQILAGLDMTLSGDISDGTIFTQVKISLNDLQKFNSFTAVGTQLQLPQTANREISTDVRTRSNDTILLAGINTSRSVADHQGMPTPSDALLATSVSGTQERSEMVIVLKPRIIKFVNRKPAPAPFAEIKKAEPATPAETVLTKQQAGPVVEILNRRDSAQATQ
jgi:MSHA biogenesis protein MshL